MKQERKIELDVLRGLAIFAVVLIHSIDFVSRSSGLSIFWKNSYVVLDQVCRFSVPLFVAISGFVLARKYFSIADVGLFFKKRILRLLPAYLFCSLILYYFLRLPTVWFQRENYSWLEIFVLGKADYPFYFVPMIVQMYVLFPLISFLIDHSRKLILLLAFLMQLGIISFFTYQNEGLKIWGPDFSDLKQYFFFGSWIFYFVLGIFLAKPQKVFSFKVERLFFVLVMVGLVWTITDSIHLLNRNYGLLVATRFTRLPVMMFSSSLIVWLLSRLERVQSLPNILYRFLHILGKDSYYLYLTHTLFMRILLMSFPTLLGSNLIALLIGTIFSAEVAIKLFFKVFNQTWGVLERLGNRS